MPTKYQQRKEHLAKFDIELSSMLEDVTDTGPDEAEAKFITTLVNMLQAYDQSKNCPCYECTENFVARARRFHTAVLQPGHPRNCT